MGELPSTYTRASVRGSVGLDPDYVLASAVAPLCEDFSATFESLARAAANPEEDEAGIRREGGDWELLEVLPGERRREGRIEEDHIELRRMQTLQSRKWEIGRGNRVAVHRCPFQPE
jgi:hypothetical protein